MADKPVRLFSSLIATRVILSAVKDLKIPEPDLKSNLMTYTSLFSTDCFLAFGL